MKIDPIIEQRRQDYLEWLYLASGRNNGLYTGLVQQRKQELMKKDMDQALGPLGDWA